MLTTRCYQWISLGLLGGGVYMSLLTLKWEGSVTLTGRSAVHTLLGRNLYSSRGIPFS